MGVSLIETLIFMTKIGKMGPIKEIKHIEKKFVDEINEETKDDQSAYELNKMYKNQIRKKFVENQDKRNVQDILKDEFNQEKKVN